MINRQNKIQLLIFLIGSFLYVLALSVYIVFWLRKFPNLLNLLLLVILIIVGTWWCGWFLYSRLMLIQSEAVKIKTQRELRNFSYYLGGALFITTFILLAMWLFNPKKLFEIRGTVEEKREAGTVF